MILLNISEYLNAEAEILPIFTPLIRGRLLSVKRLGSESLDSENIMEREANLTWKENLPESNKIVRVYGGKRTLRMPRFLLMTGLPSQ